ncbi:acylneuraminate cytidylyltransferase [Paramicrobacterium agarici]|uniref:N-acylneuraminate cytidylyltransferase n=1 Tax=Paramicrobacterium agarici TaxID=630514 RepID=A0A2A9DZH3_9MICO|nr:acylneuraminate cytidylyltransferase [Microbacterium agarici]PFG32004.1 N-acylneuraminate cytidylyltransferase [Microbacterium agarici]
MHGVDERGHDRATVVAIIPARGGSQGIPAKNLREVGGTPLIVRAIEAAAASARIQKVVVSTDDEQIAAVARAAGADVIERPDELATHEATSESALLHALAQLDARGAAPEITVFIQATSPFIDPVDIDEAIARVASGTSDVVFSAVPNHSFLWRPDEIDPGNMVGVNHRRLTRQRRQDRPVEYRETGAFYVLRTRGFLEAKHRFFGRVGVQLVAEQNALEIDTLDDLRVARAIVDVRGVDGGRVAQTASADSVSVAIGDENSAPAERAALTASGSAMSDRIDVDAVVTDFDGVHTDDTAIIGADGEELVRVSRRDGAGIARLRAAGIRVLILSAEKHPVVAARARKLEVDVRQGIDDKGAALSAWARANGIRLDRIAYLGNDLGDVSASTIVGWPMAVADAAPEVRAAARRVLTRRGGDGAVRELADAVLRAVAHAQPPAVAHTEGALS